MRTDSTRSFRVRVTCTNKSCWILEYGNGNVVSCFSMPEAKINATMRTTERAFQKVKQRNEQQPITIILMTQKQLNWPGEVI